MTVQDDVREAELCRIFNLKWDRDHRRDGTDAYVYITVAGVKYQIDVEVKSTTGDTVSTARDVGMDHIGKWSNKVWVVGYYTKDRAAPSLKSCLCLTPTDMAPWIESIREKIAPDFLLAQRAADQLTIEDLNAICGAKAEYEIQDARRLHKMQWSTQQYIEAADIVRESRRTLSPPRMLEILKARAVYIAERGATLNNPHVTKAHLKKFLGTPSEITEDHAISFRSLMNAYISANPGHPFARIA